MSQQNTLTNCLLTQRHPVSQECSQARSELTVLTHTALVALRLGAAGPYSRLFIRKQF